MASGPSIEFHYDISCPFAYIASTRIEALAARTGANIVWRPVLLGGIYRATNAPQGAAGSASDVFNPTKKAITSRAFQRTIQRYGIPHNPPPRHPMKTTAALRLLYFVDESQRPALTKALFRAYWVDGRNVSDYAVLEHAVQDSGISRAEQILQAVQDRTFEGKSQREQLASVTSLAIRRGSPGVPAFWIADEQWTDREGKMRNGRLYWGQDRMQFVEAVLLGLNEEKTGDELHAISTPLQSLTPRCARTREIPSDQEVKVQFWYDFSSPWAFLGYTQLGLLQRQFGNRLRADMKPFLLGILFRQIGAPNLPMAAISLQKRQYSQLDHADWCRWWNAVNKQAGSPDRDINFHWAEIFPIRTPLVLRTALVEPKLTDALFRGCWERNLDMASTEVLTKVITEAGYSAADIIARANDEKCKNDLRVRTQEAQDIGICGVPSYRVFRRKVGQSEKNWVQIGDTVWGQDELAVVEDLIAGWGGDGIADVGTSTSKL